LLASGSERPAEDTIEKTRQLVTKWKADVTRECQHSAGSRNLSGLRLTNAQKVERCASPMARATGTKREH
jgi:hypothetical protein